MRTSLTLEDDSRPAELQSCHPRGDSKFALKMRPGGLVRVYDGALVTGVSAQAFYPSLYNYRNYEKTCFTLFTIGLKYFDHSLLNNKGF